MKLSQLKQILPTVNGVNFKLQDGTFVPGHFHVTEVGIVIKHFIDCGGKVRIEKSANLQLWDADDYEHRLKPQKLQDIIQLSERILGMEDLDVEVEYQSDTIGKYNLDFDGSDFILLSKKTSCLAQGNCGILEPKEINSRCSPENSCC